MEQFTQFKHNIILPDATLTEVGNYRIISFQESFANVLSVAAFQDVVSGGNPAVELQRFYRWSKDGSNWSLWIDMEGSPPPLSLLSTNPNDQFFIEFKYQVIATPGFSPAMEPGQAFSPSILIEKIIMTLNYRTVDPFAGFKPVHSICSDQFGVLPIVFNKNFTFQPYNVTPAINLYKDMANMVNNLFGHEVVYFRVNPQKRGTDVVLKEYTVYEVEEQQCVKVLVPNNEFPDAKFSFNEFGIDFEAPFEIHVVREYFEQFFGKNKMPQKRDVIYFPLMNRIYEVQSCYIFRDFMYQPLYFKAMLVKYQPKSDTIYPDDIARTFEDLTITTEELFGEETQKNIEKDTKPQQYVTITHQDDPTRGLVHRMLPIDHINLYNNYLLVAQHLYDLNTLFNDAGPINAVTYRSNSYMDTCANRSYTCWFRLETNTKTADPTRNLLYGLNQSGSGLAIDLLFNPSPNPSQVRLNLNGAQYFMPFQVTLKTETWYALVVNFSNDYSQASTDLWTMQANNSQLAHISSSQVAITPAVFDAAVALGINASALELTNIRLFKEMLPLEAQNIVLNQLIVKDSENALIIDNAKPLLRIPRLASPK